MPVIDGILETALYVRDLARAVAFYERVLGFRKLQEEAGRLVGMQVGESAQVLLLFQESASTKPTETPGGLIPAHDAHGDIHAAFAINTSSVGEWRAVLQAQNVPLESEVRPERGGTSLYFRDPDHHLIELASPGIWPNY